MRRKPGENTPLLGDQDDDQKALGSSDIGLDPTINSRDDGAAQGMIPIEPLEGLPLETDSENKDYDQPIITLIQDPYYNAPDDKIFDNESGEPLVGVGLDYETLYSLLTAPTESHRFMRAADQATHLRTLRKTVVFAADLNFEYYPYALPIAIPLFFLSTRVLQIVMDSILSSLGISAGDSELNWDAFIYLLIPCLFFFITLQKMLKEVYLLKRGEREAEFPHDYIAWMAAHPQSGNPNALVRPQNAEELNKIFFPYHAGFLAFLRRKNYNRALSAALASIRRNFPYSPTQRVETTMLEAPEEFVPEGLTFDASSDREAKVLHDASTDQEQAGELSADDKGKEEAGAFPEGYFPTVKEVLAVSKDYVDDGVRSDWGKGHQESLAKQGMNSETLGVHRVPHIFSGKKKTTKNLKPEPEMVTPKPVVKKEPEFQQEMIYDVFSVPLIRGGNCKLESGQVVNLPGFAHADPSEITQARRGKKLRKNPVPPPVMNMRNVGLYLASYVGQIHAPLSYELSLMPPAGRSMEEGKIYLRKVNLGLGWKILDATGFPQDGTITPDEIPGLAGKIRDVLNLDELKPFLSEILEKVEWVACGAPLQQRRNYNHTNFAIEKRLRQKFLYTSPRFKLLDAMLETDAFQMQTPESTPEELLPPVSPVSAIPERIQNASEENRNLLNTVSKAHHASLPDVPGFQGEVRLNIQEESFPLPNAKLSVERMAIAAAKPPQLSRIYPTDREGLELQNFGRHLFCVSRSEAVHMNKNVEYASWQHCTYDDPELLQDFLALSGKKQARYIYSLFFGGDSGKLLALSVVQSQYLSHDQYFNFIREYLNYCEEKRVPLVFIANQLCFLVERAAPYEEHATAKKHRTQALFEKNTALACAILVALTSVGDEHPAPVVHAQRLFYESYVTSSVRRDIVKFLTKHQHDDCLSQLMLVSFDQISKLQISINPQEDRYFDLRYLFNSKNPKHVERVFGLVVQMLVGDLGHHQAQGIAYYFTKDNRMEEFLNRSGKSSANAEILVKKLGELKGNCPQATARLAFAMMRTVIFRKKGLFKEREGAEAKPLLIRKLCTLFYPESENLIDVFLKMGLQVRQDAWRSNEKYLREIFKYALHKGKKKSTTDKPLDTPILLKNFIAQFAAMPETPKEREKHRAVLFTLAQVFLEHRLTLPFEHGAFLLALDVYENRPLKAVLFGDFFRAACTLNLNAENKFAVLGKLMDAYYQDYQNGPVSKRMKDSAKLLKHEKSALFWALWCNLARNYAEHQAGEMASEIVREMLKDHCDQLPANPIPDLMSIFCLAPENFHQKDLKKLLLWLFLPRVKTDYRKFTRSFMNVLNSYMAAEVSYPEIIMGHDTTAEGRLAACRCTAMIIYSLYDSLFWQGGQRKLRMVKTKNKEANSKILGCASGMYKALSHLHKKAAIGISLEAFVEKFSKSTIFSDMGFSSLVVRNIFVFIRRYQSKLDPNSYQFIGEYLETEDLQIDEEAFDLLIDGIDLDESSSSATEEGKQEAAPPPPPALLIDINNSNLEPTKSATAAPLQSDDEEEESTVSEDKITKRIEKAVTVRPEEKLSPPVEAKREPKKDSDADELEGSTSSEEGSDAPLLKVSIAEPQKNEAVSEADEWPEDGEEDDEEWSEEDHIGSGFGH